jgi:phosphatidylinositol alpha-mannosyltransferase
VRVALVCPYSISSRGGVQAQVLGLADALRALGHDATVIAPGEGPSPDADGIATVGRCVRIPVNGSTAAMAPLPGPLGRTRQILRRGDFDVLHLHEPLAPSITIAALLSPAAPIVGTFHAAGDRTPYRALGALLKPLAGRLDRRVAVSVPAERLARRHLGGTYDVLFNGIDLHRYDAPATTTVEEPTILFVGRHEPRKGLGTLLEAMSDLPAGVRLWIAGDGSLGPALRRRYGRDRRIEWLGQLDEDDKIERLRAASVLCVPSLHGESFGVNILEAMAARTPVVASDLPGYRQLAGGGAALLAPPGDPQRLAACLLTVLRDPALANDITALGHQRAQRHDITELARRYISIYEHIASPSTVTDADAR